MVSLDATAGGNGGGIVIIVCDTLKGNGKTFQQADGGTPCRHIKRE